LDATTAGGEPDRPAVAAMKEIVIVSLAISEPERLFGVVAAE
jgi:hypothetical protein